jgi:mRNA interferase MazF
MSPGDIVWVDLPATGGHAQAGRRPAIVVQEASVSSVVPTALIVPLTTQIDALRFPGTFLIEPDVGNGLRRASVALIFQLTAVDQRRIGAGLGRVAEAGLEELWSQHDRITGRERS